MIVRLELDTNRPEDREILARVFGDAPVPPDAATDELVAGRDALSRIVVAWRKGLAPEEPIHSPEIRRYVEACGGLLGALLAVWEPSGEAFGPAEDAVRRESARELAATLMTLWRLP